MTKNSKNRVLPPPLVPPEQSGLTLEEYLRQVGRFCVEMHNHFSSEQIPQMIRPYCSPHFKVISSYPETYLLAADLDEYLNNIKTFRKANPDYSVKSTNLTVDIDEEESQAVLISTMEVRGLLGASDKLVRESVYLGRWRKRRDGCWVVYQLEILRGPGVEGIF